MRYFCVQTPETLLSGTLSRLTHKYFRAVVFRDTDELVPQSVVNPVKPFCPEFIGYAKVSAKQRKCKLLCTALPCLRQGAATYIIQQARSWLLITVYECDLHSSFVSAVAVNMLLFL